MKRFALAVLAIALACPDPAIASYHVATHYPRHNASQGAFRPSHPHAGSLGARSHSATSRLRSKHSLATTAPLPAAFNFFPDNYSDDSPAIAPGPQSLRSCANPNASACVDAKGYIVHVPAYITPTK